jgi:hypothetical protein
VAAVTRGETVRLQPAAVLRSRGALDPTLLHEALHVAIEARARPGLPVWFREGLALHLSEAGPDRDRAREAARLRAGRLIRQHGLAVVLGWVANGLPAGERGQ